MSRDVLLVISNVFKHLNQIVHFVLLGKITLLHRPLLPERAKNNKLEIYIYFFFI